MADSTLETDFEPDVGVLIVHGIGTQAEGSELRHWVDSVVSYLEAFRTPAERATDPRIHQSNPGDDKLVRLRTPPFDPSTPGQDWLIGEAWWADAFDVPDRREVTRWLVDVASWFVYLFVVRLWRRFHVDAVHVVIGGFLAGSIAWYLHRTMEGHTDWSGWIWVLVAGAVTLVGALRRKKDEKFGSLVVTMSLLVIYPLAGLASVGVVVLWLVGLLPGKVSKKTREIQLSLAGNIGDVYALISSARREQLMFDALARAVRCVVAAPGMVGKPLVLFAHSEGSALAYRAFNRDAGVQAAIGGRKVTLVTYGEAIIPVQVFERRLRDAKPAWLRVQGLAGLLGLLLFAFTLGRVAADSIDAVSRATAAASFALVVASFAATQRQEKASRCGAAARRARKKNARRNGTRDGVDAKVGLSMLARLKIARAGRAGDESADDTVTIQSGVTKPTENHPSDDDPSRDRPTKEVCLGLRAPQATHLRWVDLWAPWDPVPNGPLSVACPCLPKPCGPAALPTPDATDEFVSCRVSNVHQPWRDHVVYRDNPEDVVSRWVGEIAARAKDVPPEKTERPRRPTDNANRARELRRKRGVRLLAEQSFTAIAGMFAIIWHWSEMDELGRIAAHRLPFLRSLLGKVSDFVPEGLRDGVFSGSRDSSHLQGLVVALGLVALVMWLEGRFANSRQASATSHYLAGHADEDLTGVGWLVVAFVLATAVVGAFVWVMPHHLKDSPTRLVHVHPAFLSTDGGEGTLSERTEVTFDPVGGRPAVSVTVVVDGEDDKHDQAELFDDVEYRVTATATGGEDCSAAFSPGTDPKDITVTCAPSATVLPKGGETP